MPKDEKKIEVPCCGNCGYGREAQTNFSTPCRSCRRYPPKQAGDVQTPDPHPWSIVPVDGWCGEHKSIEKEADCGTEEKE